MRVLSTAFSFGLVLVAGAFLVFISKLIPYSGSDPYFRQPGFFPIVTLVALVGIGLALAAKYAFGGKLPLDEELGGSVPHFRVLVPLALVFLSYILIVPWLGYLLSTLLFGAAALFAGRHLNTQSALSLVLLGLILYLVFVAYLDVWFPAAPASIEMLIG